MRASGQRSTPTMSTMPCGTPSVRVRGLLAIGRHKPAIDENDAAAGKPSRREYPVARTFDIGPQRRPGGIDQRLLVRRGIQPEKQRGGIPLRLAKLRPTRTRRQIFGRAPSRVLSVVIRFSFQTFRSSCQTPRPIRITTPAKRHQRRIERRCSRLRRGLLTSRPGDRDGLPPPCDDIAALSAGLYRAQRRSVTIRISGSHRTACTQYGG